MSELLVSTQGQQNSTSQRAKHPRPAVPTPAARIRLARQHLEPDWAVCTTNPDQAFDALEQAMRQAQGHMRRRLACRLKVAPIAYAPRASAPAAREANTSRSQWRTQR
jgi:hypothetical protein